MKHRIWQLTTASLLLAGSAALACQVPVFRYALERWEADGYRVVFTPGSSGKLSKDEQAAYDFLARRAGDDEFPANVFVYLDDVAPGKTDAASMAVIYPQKVRGLEQAPIWEGAATEENARKVVDSPARREIVKQLLAGKSAVWMLVESGNAEADGKAASTMKEALANASANLEIPEGVLTQEDLLAEEPPAGVPIDPDNILRSRVPLKIDFSVIRIKRDDPAEEVFLQMLLNLEDDLADFAKEPMVFPVFGRGRALEPLIGRGVNVDNAMDYSGYLCGACSCEVKDLNPGMDLLVSANWDAALEGSEVIIEKILPPLEGTAALTAAALASDPGVVLPAETDPEKEGEFPALAETTTPDLPLRMTWIVLGVCALVVAAASVFVLRKKAS